MNLSIIGYGVLSSGGVGPAPISDAIVHRHGPPHPGVQVQGLYDDVLPAEYAHAFVEFDARASLGRKGTASLDRRTALALVACREALSDGQVSVSDDNRHRMGVVLGTTWGSLKSMSDYTKESLLEERPYLVEPSRFPNTVMNCAAGQLAIWNKLTGVNATIAGGNMALLSVLEYSANLFRCGYADTILAGTVEEFTPHNAWAHHLTSGGAHRRGRRHFRDRAPFCVTYAGRRVLLTSCRSQPVLRRVAPGGRVQASPAVRDERSPRPRRTVRIAVIATVDYTPRRTA